MTPLRFIFGLHVHQPVGNFERVFEEHTRDVYLPFLRRVAERECLPLVLHISGPLLEWLEAHDTRYLDLVGRLVADGQAELLLSGMYEPVLAALPHVDRVEQVQWMRDAVRARFGVGATGLWLTERVWDPDLPADLAAAGIQYTLVDDRHFLISGFRPDQLYTHYRTEAGGDNLVLFPIHERLRYLVPFRPVAELEAYFGALHAAGRPLAVLADDGEKFGGWPGTREWVYGRGWLDEFLDAIGRLRRDGVIELATCGEALRTVPSGGLAYVPTASYREMETWALPADQARRLIALEKELGEERLSGPDGAFIRGGHWHNFFVKYPESNRAHKYALALSLLARRRGSSASVRRAVGRAQCNDAYWHGIFGGLYLPHLRAAIWRQLAAAEGELRRDEPLDAEVVDLDGDGDPEIWIHSSRFSAVVAPHRGAGVECYVVFATGRNHADTLTRRTEAYHDPVGDGVAAPAGPQPAGGTQSGAPSIHDLERGRGTAGAVAIDTETRALFLERLLPPHVAADSFASGRYAVLVRWATARFTFSVERGGGGVTVACAAEGLDKRLLFAADGTVTVTYRWTGAGTPPPAHARFATELSLAHPCTIETMPDAERWTYPIETVAQSDQGIERTRQGESTVLLWSVDRVAEVLGRDGLRVTIAPR